MKLSLVIPVYNEAAHLSAFLEKIDNLKLLVSVELVVVDDCSQDASWQILQDYPFKSSVKLLRQPVNCGKGAALRKGIAEASGDIIGIQDADFEYDVDDIGKLIAPFLDGKADVVYGSRFKKSTAQVHRTFHYLVNRGLTILSNLLSGLYLTDMETCYKFFRADIIQNIYIECDRFGFEPEITAKIARLRCRVLEFPISYFPRNYLEGKKITWRDGIAAMWHIVNYNVFKKKKEFFGPGLPASFIPGGSQWL